MPAPEPIDRLLKDLLKKTTVVPTGLEEAIVAAAREVWDDVDDKTIRLGGFRNGLLRVEVDNHARLAEAKTFHQETFRQRVNAYLESDPRRKHDHVTKLVFHVRGTI